MTCVAAFVRGCLLLHVYLYLHYNICTERRTFKDQVTGTDERERERERERPKTYRKNDIEDDITGTEALRR